MVVEERRINDESATAIEKQLAADGGRPIAENEDSVAASATLQYSKTVEKVTTGDLLAAVPLRLGAEVVDAAHAHPAAAAAAAAAAIAASNDVGLMDASWLEQTVAKPVAAAAAERKLCAEALAVTILVEEW